MYVQEVSIYSALIIVKQWAMHRIECQTVTFVWVCWEFGVKVLEQLWNIEYKLPLHSCRILYALMVNIFRKKNNNDRIY
jgi:hypothetical protein